MEIDAFLAAKDAMEDEIRMAVLYATHKFWGETGYTPRSIDIKLVERLQIGINREQYIVGEVKSEVEL